MVRCNQAVEIHCAQLNLIAYRFTQPRTTRVKSLGNHLHWKGAKKLLVGHRGNSKLLLHTNHAHPHGATKIERFTASEERPAAASRRMGHDEIADTQLFEHRHCERSEAIHTFFVVLLIASLRSQ